jgi:transposase InsO family protein
MVRLSKTKTANEISKLIKDVFCSFGPPILLHSDNGTEFKNKDFAKICGNFKAKQVFGRPRAPWVKGQV